MGLKEIEQVVIRERLVMMTTRNKMKKTPIGVWVKF
jgi:hypothetical protein